MLTIAKHNLEIQLKRLADISGVEMPLIVDEENSVVSIGGDVFYIKPDQMKRYLILREERATVMLEMFEQKDNREAFMRLANKNNALVMLATECYREKGSTNVK